MNILTWYVSLWFPLRAIVGSAAVAAYFAAYVGLIILDMLRRGEKPTPLAWEIGDD